MIINAITYGNITVLMNVICIFRFKKSRENCKKRTDESWGRVSNFKVLLSQYINISTNDYVFLS